MKDRSDDPLHHTQTFLPQSYISLPKYPMGSLLDKNNPCKFGTMSKHSYHGATSHSATWCSIAGVYGQDSLFDNREFNYNLGKISARTPLMLNFRVRIRVRFTIRLWLD